MFVVVLMTLIIFEFGCAWLPVQVKEDLAPVGLFGQHKLIGTERVGLGIKGDIEGSFFFGVGDVNGKIRSESILNFYWEPKSGEIVATSLPLNKFRFIIDESKKNPTVEFVFDEEWLNDDIDWGPLSLFRYDPSDKENLNYFIIDNIAMKVAKIRISSATMEKEVYLPKVNH